jgi:hypothetical protein
MTDTPSPLNRAKSGVWQRAGLTLGLLSVAYLMARLPLPGLSGEHIIEMVKTDSLQRASLGLLDMWPIVKAFAVYEIWRTLFGPFPSVEIPAPQPMARLVIIGALAIAAVQAVGIAVAYPTDVLSRAAMVASLVAASALTAWIASMISQYGLGNGLWLLVASNLCSNLVVDVANWRAASKAGRLLEPQVGLLCLFFLATVGLLVLLSRPNESDGHRSPLDPWPAIVAVLVLPGVLTVQSMVAPALWLHLGRTNAIYWVGVVELTLITLALYLFRARRLKPGDSPRVAVAKALPAAIVVSAAVLAGEALPLLYPIPMQVQGPYLVALALVAINLLEALAPIPKLAPSDVHKTESG